MTFVEKHRFAGTRWEKFLSSQRSPPAASPLAGGALGGAAGRGIIGRFFHKGLMMTDERSS